MNLLRKRSFNLAEFTRQIFPEEVTEFYHNNMSFYALINAIRSVNEQMAFDIWRYMLLRAMPAMNPKGFEHSLVGAYAFSFEERFEEMYLSALQRDENFREVLFLKTAVINDRQVWLLYLALKHGEFKLFDDCMRLFRRNVRRFFKPSSYKTETLLTRVIDRLRGRVEETYFTREVYEHISYFAQIIPFPDSRRRVFYDAKNALAFYEHQKLPSETRGHVATVRAVVTADKEEQRRIRDHDVKHPLWEENHTFVPYAVAGLSHYLTAEEAKALPVGTELEMHYDRENKFDTVAVSLHLADGTKVGYIGKPYNRAFCEMIQDGIKLVARVSEIEHDIVGRITVWVVIYRK